MKYSMNTFNDVIIFYNIIIFVLNIFNSNEMYRYFVI